MSSNAFILLLPFELIIYIASYLSLPFVVKFSLTNHYFNNIICNSEDFWRYKFVADHKYIEETIFPEGYTWKKLYHDYVLFPNIWYFGNSNESLGLGDCVDNCVPVQIMSGTTLSNIKVRHISTNHHHAVLIDHDNNLWTCGYNYNGQLGLNDKMDRHFFNQVPDIKAKQVAAGVFHTIILDLEGNIWVCGLNNHGQLGLNDYSERLQLTQILYYRAQQIAAGEYHTVILDEDNDVWVCGCNYYGQLGLGLDGENISQLTQIPNIKAKQIACGDFHTIILDENNLWACGSNRYGQLGLGHTYNKSLFVQIDNVENQSKQPFKAKYAVCGPYNTIVIDFNDNIWACGHNHIGQLGLGDRYDKTILTQIPNIKGKKCAIGDSHMGIIDPNNDVWVCGSNLCRQIGIPNTNSISILTKIENFKGRNIVMGHYYTIIMGTKLNYSIT